MSSRGSMLVYVSISREGTAESMRLDEVRILSISYEDGQGGRGHTGKAKKHKGADKLMMTLDNYDLRHFDEPLVREGDVLDVSWGYDGNMSATRECVVRKVTGGAQIKIEAHGTAVLMHLDRRSRIFRGMRRSEVAKQIAEEYGFSVERQDIDDTETVFEQINQAGMTDAALLADMAEREGMYFDVDHNGFQWHAKRLTQTPLIKFTWFNDRRGEMLTFPNVETDITAKAGAVGLKGRDPLAKTPIDARADNDATAGRSALAPVLKVVDRRTGAATFQQRTASEIVGPTTETSQGAAKSRADAAYKGGQLTAVKLSWTNVGNPSLEAKMVVELASIGALISGNYYVEGVTHKILPGPYTMDVKAHRDGTNGEGAASAGKTNDGKAGDDDAKDELEPIKIVNKQTGQGHIEYRQRGASRGAGS